MSVKLCYNSISSNGVTQMERTKFSSMTGRVLKLRLAVETDKMVQDGQAHVGDILVYALGSPTNVVACIHPDDFFDKHGNRFEY